MSALLTLIACALLPAFLAVAAGAHADGGPIVDRATGTAFEELTRVEGQSYKCLGAGVRKLMIANVYAIAFCIDAAHADRLVERYVDDHHAGLRGEPLFEALRKDPEFFQKLAGAEHPRLAVLKLRRNLSREQLSSNIRRSLSPLLPDDKLDKLTAAITAGAKKGQVVKIYALGPRLTVDVAGQSRTFEDEEVTRKVFLVWLGTKSVSPKLREDIARRAAEHYR